MNNSNDNIIQLNSRGVTSLREGNTRAACTHLRRALICLSQTPPSSESLRNAEVSAEVQHLPTTYLYNQDEDILHFYNRAFLPHREAELEGQSDVHRLTPITIYNLALTCHVAALRSSEARRAVICFQKALRLYEKALAILSGGVGYDPGRLVELAVANNMGHIYAHYNDMNMAQQCLQQVEAILHETSFIGETTEEEYRLFRSNVFMILDNEPAAPVA